MGDQIETTVASTLKIVCIPLAEPMLNVGPKLLELDPLVLVNTTDDRCGVVTLEAHLAADSHSWGETDRPVDMQLIGFQQRGCVWKRSLERFEHLVLC